MSDEETPPLHHFDRGKVFYPIVISYITQLHGFIELVSRGVVEELLEAVEERDTLADERGEFLNAAIDGRVTPLIQELELQCTIAEKNVDIDHSELAHEVLDNHFYAIATHYEQAASSLLIVAKARSENRLDRSPICEFLRHCRNAAAHGGKFNLEEYDEPRRPAHWRETEITEGLEGTRLFEDSEGNGLMRPGDPIALLWDIEQQYSETLTIDEDSSIPQV